MLKVVLSEKNVLGIACDSAQLEGKMETKEKQKKKLET